MSAFMQGLQAGSAAAKGWVDAYEAARKRKEEKELKEGLKRAGQLEQTTIPLPESYAPAPPPEAQPGTTTGMVTTPYGQRTPTANELSRAQAETQALAAQDAEMFQEYQVGGLTRTGTQFAPQEVQRARSEEMARVYEQQGMPAEAMRMRQLGQQQELTGLELDAARRKVDTERANQVAMKQLSERFASGDVLDVPNIYQIASETGANPEILVRLAADNLRLTEANVKATNDKLVKDIRKASTSPQTFNELLSKSFDPDPTDNVKPELRQVGNTYQVFYNNQPLSPVFRDTKDVPALSQLASYYTDNIKDKPLETAVQVATLEKIRAQTIEAQAKAAALPATAAGQGIDRRIKLAEQYRDQLNDLRDELENTDPKSERAQRLTKQIDDLTVKLYGVTESIRSGLQSTGKQTSVGETINVRGQVFRKTKEGPDSDSSSWEPVSGGAAPAGKPTSGARPSAPSQAEAAPVGLERMGQRVYGRLTPDSVVAEGVRRGDPAAIAEQRRRQEIEAARGVETPGYNQLGVY